MIYQRDPGMAPDSEFEAGTLGHLVVGNQGRVLDPRRTPIRIVGLRVDTGLLGVEILAFEDRGATWELPFESVASLQFAKGSARAGVGDVALFADAARRLDASLEIPADPARRAATERAILRCRELARKRLAASSAVSDLAAAVASPSRVGLPPLASALQGFMELAGLWDVEDALAAQLVRNPYSGELVKGHRIVLAELGLVAYEGKVVRDPAVLAGPWSRERREEHVLHRLAFVREAFALAGVPSVLLHRGLALDGPRASPRNRSLVSATFDVEVARSHALAGSAPEAEALLSRQVPVERIFMTYLETDHMNRQFREAEALLLFEPGNAAF